MNHFLSKVVTETSTYILYKKKPKEKTTETLKRPENIYIYIKRKSVVTFSCASKVQFNKICNVHTRKMTDSDLLPSLSASLLPLPPRPKNATQISLIHLTSSSNRF